LLTTKNKKSWIFVSGLHYPQLALSLSTVFIFITGVKTSIVLIHIITNLLLFGWRQ
jgi:hypothetical protein